MSSTQKKQIAFPFILLLSVFWLLSSGISAADAATVALAWDRSNDQEVIGYRVHYGTSRGIYQHSVDVQNNTSCSISELNEGTTYYFAATAYNNSNVESGYSEEIAHTIPNPSSPPPTIDTDGDGLFDDDETDIYGTNPNNADTDGDGINDGEELTFWGDNWSEDTDGNGLVNLVDPDSDNDGILDGLEIQQGSDPGNPSVTTSSEVVFAVNSGGPQYTSADGIVYQADVMFSGGNDYNSVVDIQGTTDDTLYQSERWGDFSYGIPMENGNYQVVVKFAEIYWNDSGRRVFDVNMEGREVITNLDLIATVGSNRAYDIVVPVNVSDGMLNISFHTDIDAAKVSAINVNSIETDSDGDGLVNLPDPDTDNDGKSPPPPPPPPADTDGDGILDDDETGIYGTDPNSVDTDGDGMNDGDEVSDGYDPLDPSSRPVSNFLTFEIGDIQLDHNWIRVNFRESYVDPIVVARPASINGSDPAVIRIRNIDTSGFDIRIQEWDYLDGSHTIETVSFFVMEKGSFTLDDGTQIEAGRFETNKTGSFGDFNFSQNFQEAPVVLAGISSLNETDAVTGRLRNISNQGFEFCMQEQERNPQEHLTETVDYIAWQTSKGNLNGYSFEVGKTANNVKDAFNIIEFNQSFGSVPHFLADMQTTDGKDTANIRWQNKNSHSVEVQIDEEQSKNAETRHTTEVIGYMVFGY